MSFSDYGAMARTVAITSGNGSTGPSPARLSDLSREDQELQRRYYQITDPEGLVRCLSCAIEGHTYSICPLRICAHCGVEDQHRAASCPTYRKCTRCRRRGHYGQTCTNASVLGGDVADPCDLCGKTGHIEEECADLWRTSVSVESNIVKLPADAVRVACYNCGSSAHWGDDCPELPDYVQRHLRAKGSYSVWSAEYASRFFDDADAAEVGKTKRGAGARNYQLAALDDMRD